MKNIIILISLLIVSVQADDFENYMNYRAGIDEYKGHVKCATKYETQLRVLINSPEKSNYSLLKKIPLTAPNRTDSLKTDHFTLHWDISGIHAVPPEDITSNGIPDYIDTAAAVLERVWDVEINQMSYTAPPQQNGQPVTSYHVYFTDMSYYGITTGSGIDIPSLPGTNWSSYLELENDYLESIFATRGLDGLRVTAAHEFHHAVQFGYNVRTDGQDYYFYEMTSTWMEDVLYDEINDYYNYLSTLFLNLGRKSFDDYSLFAYGNCLYLHMLEKQFGQDIVSEIWDRIKIEPAINAIGTVLTQNLYNTTWLRSLAEYGIWLYYTGDRSNVTQYFPEGNFYPQSKISSSSTYTILDSINVVNNILENSFRYYKLKDLKNKAVLSSITSLNSQDIGHQLMTTSQISDFSDFGSQIDNFIVDEDSAIAIITNGENFDADITFNLKVIKNFVQIDTFTVKALPGRNLIKWISSFESLIKEYKISRRDSIEAYDVIFIKKGNNYSNQKNEYIYSDEEIEIGKQYEYNLEVEYIDGTIQEIQTILISALEPLKFDLLQNNPNPFNNETTIRVEILINTEIELNIYNTRGQKVKTLQKKQKKEKNFHSYTWYGDNDAGNQVSSGVYFVVLKSNNNLKKIKIALIK